MELEIVSSFGEACHSFGPHGIALPPIHFLAIFISLFHASYSSSIVLLHRVTDFILVQEGLLSDHKSGRS